MDYFFRASHGDRCYGFGDDADGQQHHLNRPAGHRWQLVFIRIRNASGSILSRSHYLIPTNTHVYRIIANKYTAAIFVPTSTASREFVVFGTLWIPTWLQGVETNELGWIVSNADSDGDTTVRESLEAICPQDPIIATKVNGRGL